MFPTPQQLMEQRAQLQQRQLNAQRDAAVTRQTQALQRQSGRLVKARLIGWDQGVETIVFQFNPKEIKFSLSNETKDEGRTPDKIRKVSFSGPNADTLSISNITFDTYESGEDVYQKYIKKLIDSLSFKKVRDSTGTRPPIYIFYWKHRYLKCFVKSLSYTFSMFLPDGTPVRAVANLELQQATRWVKPQKK